MLRILVVGLVALVAAMLLLPRAGGPARSVEAATILPEARPLPEIELTDHTGADFSLRDLAGRPTLAFFGFTNCPDICPLTLAQIALAMDELRAMSSAPEPQVLFISVDPARDTPGNIAAYISNFDDSFIGVTTDEAAMAPLLSMLGVTVHRISEGGEQYNVVHNGTIYILDDQARWVALLGGSSHEAATIVNDYLALRPQHSPR